MSIDLAAALLLDPGAETKRIAASIADYLRGVKRRGAVLGVSGGIDSGVCAALCVRAIGKDRVFGLLMPEYDSSPDSLELGKLMADSLGIPSVVEEIGGILREAGCYTRRDAAIRSVVPAYGPGYKSKIVLPGPLSGQTYQLFSVVVRSPEGVETKVRLPLEAYLTIVAATNFKQRTRKMMEYFHADRLNYAVLGTPNLLEYDQGFAVKNGDAAADFKPIAHLYKSQVYQLAEYLEVPAIIRQREPTSDTYSLGQSQDEFFFGLPHRQMDMAIYARDHGVTAAEAAEQIGLQEDQMKRMYDRIDSRRRAAIYLNMPPALVG